MRKSPPVYVAAAVKHGALTDHGIRPQEILMRSATTPLSFFPPSPTAMGLLVALQLLSAPACAAAWQLVDSNSRAQIEVDLDSVVRRDGGVTGWVQHHYSQRTATQTGAYFAYRSMKEQVRVDCAEQSMSVLARAYFNDDGSEIAMIKGKGEARAVTPDSTEQRVLKRICNPVANAPARSATKPAQPVVAKAPPVAPAKPVDSKAQARTEARSSSAGQTKSENTERYMDGPAKTAAAGTGFVRASLDSPRDPARATTSPAEKDTEKSGDKAAAPAPNPPKVQSAASYLIPKSPAPGHHGAAPAGPTLALAAAPRSNALEGRQEVVNRVLKQRSTPTVGASDAVKAASAGHGPHDGHPAPWSYDGEFAPYRWGDMRPDYALCKAGTRQSPIDIRNPVVSEIEPIQFHYEDTPLKVLNNGHTIQVDVQPGSFILHGGTRYELVQFHFHTPSEERINGRVFDMVAHLVHKSAQGRLAVVAVLLTAGREQPMLQQIWSAMPGTPNRTRERMDVSINAKQILPADPGFYSFMGSLTTPPCTEGVQWLVMKTPVEISREQIGHFAALYPMNARPLQPGNDRLVKAGR